MNAAQESRCVCNVAQPAPMARWHCVSLTACAPRRATIRLAPLCLGLVLLIAPGRAFSGLGALRAPATPPQYAPPGLFAADGSAPAYPSAQTDPMARALLTVLAGGGEDRGVPPETAANAATLRDRALPGLFSLDGDLSALPCEFRQARAGAEVHWVAPEERPFPVATWPFVGVLTTLDGVQLPVEGRFGRCAWFFAVSLRVTDGAPVERLATRGGASVMNWPRGTDGMGKTTESTSAHGVSMWLQAPLEARVLDWGMASSWPMLVAAWSDGEHLVVLVKEWCQADAYCMSDLARGLRGDRVHGIPHYEEVALALPHEPPSARIGGVTEFDEKVLRGYKPIWNQPGVDLVAAVQPKVDRLPPEDRPTLVALDEWPHASVEDLPAVVGRYLGGLAMEPTLVVRSPGPDSEATVSGLLRSPNNRGGGLPFLGQTLMVGTYGQWSVSKHQLCVTVLSHLATDDSYYGPRPGAHPQVIDDLSVDLQLLLGEHGRRLVLVPMDLRQIEGTSWWVATPEQEHEIGLLERVKVKDTPWGRCRIYREPGILHILFDLPKEE